MIEFETKKYIIQTSVELQLNTAKLPFRISIIFFGKIVTKKRLSENY